MKGISDIRIVGMDDRHPPKIVKSPYIDLFFRLSRKAPEDWCRRFNDLLAKHPYRPNIEPQEGLYIKTWVRKAPEIPAILEVLKASVRKCTENHIAAIEASRSAVNSSSAFISPEQAELNAIIAALEFDPPLEENPA